MNRVALAGIVVLVSIVGTVLAYLAFWNWYVLDVHVREVNLTVSNGTVGFALDNDKFYFGKVPPGASSSRSMNISSPVPARAHIWIDPSLHGWVVPGQYGVELEPGEAVLVDLVAHVPEDAELGYYSGLVRVTVVRDLW